MTSMPWRWLLSLALLAVASCCVGAKPTPATERFTASDEEVAPFLRPDGTLEDDACVELCQEEYGFEVHECELVSHDPEYTESYLFECSGEYAAVCY